jgi:hypothetical protein
VPSSKDAVKLVRVMLDSRDEYMLAQFLGSADCVFGEDPDEFCDDFGNKCSDCVAHFIWLAHKEGKNA